MICAFPDGCTLIELLECRLNLLALVHKVEHKRFFFVRVYAV